MRKSVGARQAEITLQESGREMMSIVRYRGGPRGVAS